MSGGAEGRDLRKHVLSRFGAGDWQIAEDMIRQAADAVIYTLVFGVAEAMNRYNG